MVKTIDYKLWKASLNKWVFNKTLKMSRVLLFLKLFGKMFHSLGAAAQKALSSMFFSTFFRVFY